MKKIDLSKNSVKMSLLLNTITMNILLWLSIFLSIVLSILIVFSYDRMNLVFIGVVAGTIGTALVLIMSHMSKYEYRSSKYKYWLPIFVILTIEISTILFRLFIDALTYGYGY